MLILETSNLVIIIAFFLNKAPIYSIPQSPILLSIKYLYKYFQLIILLIQNIFHL